MARVAVDREKIAEFCRKWGIQELSLFGSVLRDDFRPDSDVDVLLTFAPSAGFTFRTPEFMDFEVSPIERPRASLSPGTPSQCR